MNISLRTNSAISPLVSRAACSFVRVPKCFPCVLSGREKGTYQQVRMLAEVKRMMGTG